MIRRLCTSPAASLASIYHVSMRQRLKAMITSCWSKVGLFLKITKRSCSRWSQIRTALTANNSHRRMCQKKPGLKVSEPWGGLGSREGTTVHGCGLETKMSNHDTLPDKVSRFQVLSRYWILFYYYFYERQCIVQGINTYNVVNMHWCIVIHGSTVV